MSPDRWDMSCTTTSKALRRERRTGHSNTEDSAQRSQGKERQTNQHTNRESQRDRETERDDKMQTREREERGA